MLHHVSVLETMATTAAGGASVAARSALAIDIRPIVAVLVALASLAALVVGAFLLATWAGWFAAGIAGLIVEHRLTAGSSSTARGGSWAGP